MDVTIFTGAGCTSCERAKAFMAAHNVSFIERGVADDPDVKRELMALGARTLPVIRVGDQVLSGFDPAALGALLGV